MTQRARNIIRAMFGATASEAGKEGLVVAPAAGDEAKFLRGDATWATAGGSSGPAIGLVTSDQTRTSTTTLTTLTGATTGTMEANVWYRLEIRLRMTAAASAVNAKIGLGAYPSGFTAWWGDYYSDFNNGTTSLHYDAYGASPTALLETGVATNIGLEPSRTMVVAFTGLCKCGGTAGTLSLQGAQQNSSGSAITFKDGTSITLIKLSA